MKKSIAVQRNSMCRAIRQRLLTACQFCASLIMALTLALGSQASFAEASLQERVRKNLSALTPHWLGSPDTRSYAKLIVARYQQQPQHAESIGDLLLDNPWPQYSAMFSQYIQYRLLADSGYWCANAHSDVYPELAAYLLWLQGDLINTEVTLGGMATEVCAARPVAVAALPTSSVNSAKLLTALEPALRRFQQRFGLDVNGTLDQASVAALRQGAAWAAQRLRINLLRMAELDAALGQRYLIANIPAFEVSVYERYEEVLRLKAIVGKSSRQTPQFSSELSSLVLNPGWNIPPKIVYRDLIPKQIKQSDYLSARNIAVYADWSSQNRIDPASIDWLALRGNFPYRMKQAPGPSNALGKVKFVTPNNRAIYLHDTNARNLFDRSNRALSSGCVRLQQPERLARYVLASQYTDAEIDELLNSNITRTVKVRETLPVHYVYWTSWVDNDGILQHRQDIYGLDSQSHDSRPLTPRSTLAFETVQPRHPTVTKSS